MPLLLGKSQVAIKQEAVAGSAETLAAADVILPTGPVEWEPDVLMTPREAMTGSLSPRGSVVGTQAAHIRWKQYLRGSYNHSTGAIAAPVAASTEADFSVPFKGCGMNLVVSGANPNEQAAYTPSSSTVVDETTGAYCTLAVYNDGKRYLIHGAVGNCILTFTVGMPVLAEFEFQGLYNTPTDLALLTSVVYPTFMEPAFMSAAMSVIGAFTTAKLKTLKLDFGNQIAMRSNPNSATGLFTAQITGRKATGSFDPEEVPAATNNWFAQWIAGTAGVITTGTFPSGGTNYNQFNLNIPNAIYNKVGKADRDAIVTAPIEFECMANSAAGEDEFSFTQT
jgi:hypothetical protein